MFEKHELWSIIISVLKFSTHRDGSVCSGLSWVSQKERLGRLDFFKVLRLSQYSVLFMHDSRPKYFFCYHLLSSTSTGKCRGVDDASLPLAKFLHVLCSPQLTAFCWVHFALITKPNPRTHATLRFAIYNLLICWFDTQNPKSRLNDLLLYIFSVSQFSPYLSCSAFKNANGDKTKQLSHRSWNSLKIYSFVTLRNMTFKLKSMNI